MQRWAFLLSILLTVGAGCATTPTASTTTTSDTTGYADEVSFEPMLESTTPGPTILPADRIEDKQVRITTDKGDIVIALFPDTAPLTVSNFLSLAESGFYDGLIFHRREEGFVLQGGDPLGQGYGGPGYQFADELNDNRQYTRGTVAMANSGPNTNGSQFFIMLADVPLPHLYSIFGEVTEGMEVVDALERGAVMTKVTVENQD